MTEPDITTEDVLAAGVTRREAAERIAQYANLRAGGRDKLGAIGDVGVDPSAVTRYERWTAVVRERLGLPALLARPGPREQWGTVAEKSVLANHRRYHSADGLARPGCPHCASPAAGAGVGKPSGEG